MCFDKEFQLEISEMWTAHIPNADMRLCYMASDALNRRRLSGEFLAGNEPNARNLSPAPTDEPSFV
jgi:hypothetical protein